jgi:ABC-type antimicrobial peptide transport system permease subunit
MVFAQFLIEAFIICASGAAAGMACAFGTGALVRTEVSPALAMIGFVVCCGAGLVASVGPARAAAALQPAVALRAQ